MSGWPTDAGADPAPINQFAMNLGLPNADGSVETSTLLLGYGAQPMLMSAIAAEAYWATHDHIPIALKGAFVLTPPRMREMRDLLNKHLQLIDSITDGTVAAPTEIAGGVEP